MNRTLKRVLGLTGSVMLGVAGAVTFASAAQAHHADYWGTSSCNEDGTWTVTWEATDGTWNGREDNLTATVKDWTVNGDVFSEQFVEGEYSGDLFTEGAPLPPHGSTDTLKGTQVVPGDVQAVSLTLSSKWSNDNEDTGQPYLVSQPEGGCETETPEEPEPAYFIDSEVDCVGVWVWAENTNPEKLAEFSFVASNGEEVSGEPGVEEEFQHYFLLEDGAEALTVEVFVNGELVDTIEWYSNELCSYIQVDADCEGLIFTLSVPADGPKTYFSLYTSLSDEVEDIELAAGESETRTFKAEGDEELWVDYYIATQKDETYGGVKWIPCDEESPAPSPSDTPPAAKPELPVTGSSLSIMIGSAAALIVAAAAILLIMRRRRAAQDW